MVPGVVRRPDQADTSLEVRFLTGTPMPTYANWQRGHLQKLMNLSSSLRVGTKQCWVSHRCVLKGSWPEGEGENAVQPQDAIIPARRQTAGSCKPQ